MIRPIGALILLASCSALAGDPETAAAQSAESMEQPQFEVASVKPSNSPYPASMPPELLARARESRQPPRTLPMPSPGRLRIRRWSLQLMVAAAYSVQKNQVFGPPWMDDEYFDIDAKLPEDAKSDQTREMLQALLAERFGLQLHREKREVQGFALVVGKHGAKLQEYVPPASATAPATREESDARRAQMMAKMTSRAPGVSSSWQGDNLTPAELAERLMPMAHGPVVDETGLTGKYNVEIETWSGNDQTPGQTVFQAVENLGLKLEPRKVQIAVLVVEKISRTPTPN